MNARTFLRQSAFTSAFEMRRCISSWRFAASIVAMILISVMCYINFADSQDSTGFSSPFLQSTTMLTALTATIMASQSISDEFEKKTALSMFAKPINRSAVASGKIISAYILCSVIVLLYFGILVAISLARYGNVADGMGTSLLLTFLLLFAMVGLCSFVSSLSPSSGLSMLICFVVLVIVQLFIDATDFTTEPWYYLGYDARIIPNYVEGTTTVYFEDMTTISYEPLLGTAAFMMSIYGIVSTTATMIVFRFRNIQ